MVFVGNPLAELVVCSTHAAHWFIVYSPCKNVESMVVDEGDAPSRVSMSNMDFAEEVEEPQANKS